MSVHKRRGEGIFPRLFFLCSYVSGKTILTLIMDDGSRNREVFRLTKLVGDLYRIDSLYERPENIQLALTDPGNDAQRISLLKDRLTTAGYDFSMQSKENLLVLSINPKRRLAIPRINIILFLITLFSVYFMPVFLLQERISSSLQEALQHTLLALADGAGIQFTIALISILLVHEMGHYLVGRHHGIITSWPYFIPAPSMIGTFGAVIRAKSPFWSRRELIQVAAAGPIAGWVVAIGWLVYGLSHSVQIPISDFGTTEFRFVLSGESVLMRLLVPLLIEPAVDGMAFHLTEAAFAGWVGLLITAMNLLPIGQMDGGHILYGGARKIQHRLGWLAVAVLLYLGTQFVGWWLFAGLGMLMGVRHPPTLDDRNPPGKFALTMALISLVILILSFTPVPFG